MVSYRPATIYNTLLPLFNPWFDVSSTLKFTTIFIELAIIANIVRFIIKLIGILVLLAGLYLIAAFMLGLIPVNKNYVQAEHGTNVLISSNGVHLDIIMPVATEQMDWRVLIPPDHFPGTVAQSHYIGFGWGEKNFYINTPTWADLQPKIAINAMLWPTSSAMHVNYYKAVPMLDHNTLSITLNDQEFEALLSYIYRSFQLRDDKAILIEEAGYDMNDNFYEAHGKYHMFFTSNDWVNKALKIIGIRAAIWSPFDKAVLYQLRKVQE
jgi:uncharacterized protein (TIGR02117 family)